MRLNWEKSTESGSYPDGFLAKNRLDLSYYIQETCSIHGLKKKLPHGRTSGLAEKYLHIQLLNPKVCIVSVTLQLDQNLHSLFHDGVIHPEPLK